MTTIPSFAGWHRGDEKFAIIAERKVLYVIEAYALGCVRSEQRIAVNALGGSPRRYVLLLFAIKVWHNLGQS